MRPTIASSHLLGQQRVRETGPRTRRPKMFSSRSSASAPAASSTVTNISENATAIAAAKS